MALARLKQKKDKKKKNEKRQKGETHLLFFAIQQNPGVAPIQVSERHHQCVIHYLFDGDRNPGAGPQLLGRGLHVSWVKCPAWRCSFPGAGAARVGLRSSLLLLASTGGYTGPRNDAINPPAQLQPRGQP